MPELMLKVVSATSQVLVPLGDEPITVGRHPGNVLRLRDERTSRYHCVIERCEEGARVTDLNSRNGTHLNGQRISSAVMRVGDVLRVGGVQIELVVKEPQEARTEGLPRKEKAPEAGVKREEPGAVKWEITVEPGEEEQQKQLPRAKTEEAVPAGAKEEPAEEVAEAGPKETAESGALSVVNLSDIPWEGQPVPAARRGPQIGPSERIGALDEPPSADVAEIIRRQEQQLRQILDNLSDQSLTEFDVVLVNARGQRMNIPEPRAGQYVPGREGLVMFRLLLLLCARTGASDLHVEPKRDDFLVRIRVDGMMVEIMHLHKAVAARLTNVVKVVSDLDISQKMIIQEGHFSTELAGRRVDYRVSFAPAMFGQNLVIRVLDMARVPCYVRDLGMPRWMSQSIYQTCQQDAGMLIVCGPTGSGKTTTLYAVIRDIDVSRRNVITIEDPPEFNIEGVTQIGINEQQGNTFSSLLRSVLRQDPDVILVGEIRDAETARIAMQASMTGHLVLTTVHARDGLGTIFRLLDLGVEPFLIASALNLVLAQRLVRKLCPYCKVPAKPRLEHLQGMGRHAEGVSQIYFPGGCPRCLGTGYNGRQGIFELVTATEELKDVILKRPTLQELKRAVSNTVFCSLRDSGYQLVAQGITSVDEIDRVLGIE